MRRSLALLLLLSLAINVSTAAEPLNILNNGGFEYGLMCFGNWIWSQTGLDYRGDYEFLLSPDAHSGSKSVEIRCAGTDCAKAAIISNKIPSPPGQSYDLSMYTKCPAGRNAVVYVPGTTSGDIVQALTCNGSWALNRVSFQFPPSVTEFFFSVYNRDIEWFRVDDIVLTYGSGDAPHQTVLYPGVRNVTVSDKALMVDGAPYLALGFFSVGYDDLQLAANQGANTVSALLMSPATDCFTTRQKNYLDRAYELGLGFVPDSSTTARLRMPEVFPAIMQRFAPHLANIAWMLVDEPDQSAVRWYYTPGPTVAAEYTAAKSATSLPVFSNFQRAAWSSSAEVAPYVSAVDYWMAEPYGEDFGSVRYAIDMFNSLRPRPVWLAQDAIDARLIVPKAYWAVIQGATGIIYFDWDTFKSDPAKLAAARQAFGELNGLKGAFFGRNLDSIVTAPAGIGYIARQDQGTVYIAAANPTATPVQGKFTVPGLAAGAQVSVLFESRTITASAGEFSDSFPGVSRHVYAIQSGITVATSPAGLQVVVDGTTLTAPQTFQWTPGGSHTLDVVTPQASNGVRRMFGSWSDSGAKSHSIAAPVTATTYTASFTTQYLLTTAASPAAAGAVTAAPSSSDGYYNSGQSVQLTANVASGYTFANWSGDQTGSANPGNVVMSAPRSVTANFAAQVVNSPPTVAGVIPAAGATATQAFTFGFTDPNGWQDLSVVNILVNFWLDGRNSCYLAYSRPANTLYLINNAGDGYAGSMSLNGSGTLGNSQCLINGAGSSVSGAGNTMALTLNMTFPASFAGAKIIYAAARDVADSNSSWQRMGVWQVPGAVQPTTTAVPGMNPARGSGSGGTFTFTFTDTMGANELGVMNILVNDWLDGRHACYLAYARANNTLYLVNDNGDALLPGKVLDGTGSLGNSQCTVNGAGSSATPSGNALTLTLNMTFGGGFAGNRVFYLAARDVNEQNNTGWQAMGSWTVQ